MLGGGRVGNAIVRDLAAEEDFSVLVVDVDPVVVERLTDHGADGVVADLSDLKKVSQAAEGADLVVSAMPGFMGYKTVERSAKAVLTFAAGLEGESRVIPAAAFEELQSVSASRGVLAEHLAKKDYDKCGAELANLDGDATAQHAQHGGGQRAQQCGGGAVRAALLRGAALPAVVSRPLHEF